MIRLIIHKEIFGASEVRLHDVTVNTFAVGFVKPGQSPVVPFGASMFIYEYLGLYTEFRNLEGGFASLLYRWMLFTW